MLPHCKQEKLALRRGYERAGLRSNLDAFATLPLRSHLQETISLDDGWKKINETVVTKMQSILEHNYDESLKKLEHMDAYTYHPFRLICLLGYSKAF